MKVIELGNYIAPAYAGMLLAEQGHMIEKWLGPAPDPIQGLIRGAELWQWINARKTLVRRDAALISTYHYYAEVVIDNFTPAALNRWGINPAELAKRYNVRWISIRDELGERSFDIIAQARSVLEFSPYSPSYLGDTAAGLFAAFKAVCSAQAGHYVLGHASCLQKLVEGELMVSVDRNQQRVPWDREQYDFDPNTRVATVEYRGEIIIEPVRDHAWKRTHLFHKDGRIII